jgi:hypothetical protein
MQLDKARLVAILGDQVKKIQELVEGIGDAGDVAHKGADSLAAHDQPLGFQAIEGAANGRPADLELCRQLVFRGQQAARWVSPAADFIYQQVQHL